jgi:hypothetical protein
MMKYKALTIDNYNLTRIRTEGLLRLSLEF